MKRSIAGWRIVYKPLSGQKPPTGLDHPDSGFWPCRRLRNKLCPVGVCVNVIVDENALTIHTQMKSLRFL